MVDNYDSFTYNLVEALRRLPVEVVVFRNDEVDQRRVEAIRPVAIVISPGPGRPSAAGETLRIVQHFHDRLPILGICLGHQALAEFFGARVVRAPRPMHGKTTSIHHDGRTIFAGLPQAFPAARYHSLVVSRVRFPPTLQVSATAPDRTIMALRHVRLPIEGVQFHPESFLTPLGPLILRNFVKMIARVKAKEA